MTVRSAALWSYSAVPVGMNTRQFFISLCHSTTDLNTVERHCRESALNWRNTFRFQTCSLNSPEQRSSYTAGGRGFNCQQKTVMSSALTAGRGFEEVRLCADFAGLVINFCRILQFAKKPRPRFFRDVSQSRHGRIVAADPQLTHLVICLISVRRIAIFSENLETVWVTAGVGRQGTMA